jgi:hypothetical protein
MFSPHRKSATACSWANYKFDRKDRTGRIHAFGKWCYVEVLVDGWRVQEVDEVAIIPCIPEASGHKYPYEVLSRNLHKLLMDTATSE